MDTPPLPPLLFHLTELDADIAAANQPDDAREMQLRLLVRAVLENYRDADNHHTVELNASAKLSAERVADLQRTERRIVRPSRR